MIKITEMEYEILQEIKLNAEDCSGGDFAIGGEVIDYVKGRYTPQQVGALFTNLEKKGLISLDLVEFQDGSPDLTQIEIHTDDNGNWKNTEVI